MRVGLPDGSNAVNAQLAAQPSSAATFQRLLQSIARQPGIASMTFAINEVAEPRVLEPWGHKSRRQSQSI